MNGNRRLLGVDLLIVQRQYRCRVGQHVYVLTERSDPQHITVETYGGNDLWRFANMRAAVLFIRKREGVSDGRS